MTMSEVDPNISRHRQETTRLAPSPTGALHLGNARTFLVNWAVARKRGWRIVLRIEDLDTPRVKPGAVEGAIEILRRLGMDWDEGPRVQSEDMDPYCEAMRRLADSAMAYPCTLTRREIEAAASAPHADADASGGEVHCPPSLRPRLLPRRFDDGATNWRFATPPGPVEFADEFAGPLRPDPSRSVGDFVIWTKRAQPSYQLAVVIDDHRDGVTRVVRGDDLVDSAGRQLLLYRALGLGPEPSYTHLPLVVGQDGRRLAKRHGDTRIDTYLAAGVPVEAIVGLIASWCGIGSGPPEPMSTIEFMDELDPCKIPPERVVMTPEDDQWLHSWSKRG